MELVEKNIGLAPFSFGSINLFFLLFFEDKQRHSAAAALRPWEWAWAGAGNR
jgi:hypothetical protein